MNLRDAIAEVYRQVDAPDWAAMNLDALIDVLRDLSWLPEGTVDVVAPSVAGRDGARFRKALQHAVADTAGGSRSVRLVPAAHT